MVPVQMICFGYCTFVYSFERMLYYLEELILLVLVIETVATIYELTIFVKLYFCIALTICVPY